MDILPLRRAPTGAAGAACSGCGLADCLFREMANANGELRAQKLQRGDRMEARATQACLTFWIITDGTAASCMGFEDGRRQILSLERPGDVVCAPMSCAGTHTWLEALSDCDLCVLDLSAHANALRGDANFLKNSFGIAHRRLAHCQEHLSTIGRLDSQERVTFFLAEMAAHSPAPVVSLPMSREDIADYLGLNAETVSRVLSKLKKKGLVTFLSPTTYIIPDLGALQRWLPVPVPAARAEVVQ